MRFRKLNVSLFVFLLLLPGCASRNPGDPVQHLLAGSGRATRPAGRSASGAAGGGCCATHDCSSMSAIWATVWRASHRRSSIPYEFTLINDPSINAFALPGGPIFIHSGLIAHADNEGQARRCSCARDRARRAPPWNQPGVKGAMLQVPAALAGSRSGRARAQIGGRRSGADAQCGDAEVLARSGRRIGRAGCAIDGECRIQPAGDGALLRKTGGAREDRGRRSSSRRIPVRETACATWKRKIQAMPQRNYSQAVEQRFQRCQAPRAHNCRRRNAGMQ
jgi:hypothetical protein